LRPPSKRLASPEKAKLVDELSDMEHNASFRLLEVFVERYMKEVERLEENYKDILNKLQDKFRDIAKQSELKILSRL